MNWREEIHMSNTTKTKLHAAARPLLCPARRFDDQLVLLSYLGRLVEHSRGVLNLPGHLVTMQARILDAILNRFPIVDGVPGLGAGGLVRVGAHGLGLGLGFRICQLQLLPHPPAQAGSVIADLGRGTHLGRPFKGFEQVPIIVIAVASFGLLHQLAHVVKVVIPLVYRHLLVFPSRKFGDHALQEPAFGALYRCRFRWTKRGRGLLRASQEHQKHSWQQVLGFLCGPASCWYLKAFSIAKMGEELD